MVLPGGPWKHLEGLDTKAQGSRRAGPLATARGRMAPWAEAVWGPGALHVDANGCHDARAFRPKAEAAERWWRVLSACLGRGVKPKPCFLPAEGVGRGLQGRPLLSLGVREALEAGVFLTGRGSWEARPPGVDPHWEGSNIRGNCEPAWARASFKHLGWGTNTDNNWSWGWGVLQAWAWEGAGLALGSL